VLAEKDSCIHTEWIDSAGFHFPWDRGREWEAWESGSGKESCCPKGYHDAGDCLPTRNPSLQQMGGL
jgi:hypothetical protein